MQVTLRASIEPAPKRASAPLEKRLVTVLFQKSCRACHGSDGKGDTIRPEIPEIPDFSRATWQDRRSRTQLTASILEGKGRHMPAFRDKLTAEQSRALADVIRGFGPTPPASVNSSTEDFDVRFSRLQEELDAYKREYRLISKPPASMAR